ncbi:hypothetical protein BA900_03580 [Spiribacter roseus]|nr:hypothetical protein BA900_03580 [Spiribacter roseus]
MFYNVESGDASSDIWQVMPAVDVPVELHPEGLYNFLDFGYSVFGQTPVTNVRFLPPASQLFESSERGLEVVRQSDPVDDWWDYRLAESDVIELIRERVQNWEASLPPDQEIVLPLSGGYDSRLLLWCLKDKERVRAYTYGLSEDQYRSTEVVHARTLARHFGIRWERIPIGDQHWFFADWNAAFGISTHAHGMYHFEFYTKIRERLIGNQAFLSGIIGDAWAGSLPRRQLRGANDLTQLGYSHGLRADPQRLRLSASNALRNQFWSENRDRLSDHRFQVVASMRLKLMLLSYLMSVPRRFGFQPWTPFLDIDIAMAMLNLPQVRRANRQWQRDFFLKVGLDLENKNLKSKKRNSLNHQAMRRCPVERLDMEKLSEVFDQDYIRWINRNVDLSALSDLRTKVLGVPKAGGALKRLGVRDKSLEAYGAYLCLRPIEKLL